MKVPKWTCHHGRPRAERANRADGADRKTPTHFLFGARGMKHLSLVRLGSLEPWELGYGEKVDIPHRIGYDIHQFSTSMV